MTNASSYVSWPIHSMSELLKRVRHPVAVNYQETYREIGIRSHCKGIFHKPPTTGEEIGNKRVFWVKPGCLIFNIIFAWEQAVAMTSENEAGMIASHRFPMYTSRNGKLLPEYAWRYFSSPRGKYDLGIASPGGAGRNKTLGQAEFDQLKIPVPSRAYQRMVVDTLAVADRAIAQTESLIATKRKLKKGLAQRLITGELRFSDFRESWIYRSLGSLGDCVSGGTPDTRRAEYWGGEHVWCTPSDIPDSSPVIRSTERTITDEGLKASSATLVPSGALIVCTRASVGESAITGVPLATNQGFKSLVFGEDVCPEFIYYSLVEQRHVLERLASGSTFREVSKRDFVRLELAVPQQIEEQQRIAAVLGCLGRHVELLQTKLTALREIKRGLMQRLFADSTSEVRLAIGENRNAS